MANDTLSGTNPAAGQSDLDLSSLDKQFDPQITAERESAEHYEQQSVSYSEQEATATERMAADEPANMQAMDTWLNSQPTRQAAYGTVMHTAPMFALIAAIGGKVTKLSGMNMLAATNGIVQGLNQASEKLYEDSYNAWMAQYNKLKEHQQQLQRQHQLMLEAYRGRADAYQKAGDAARRMTGDLLDQKQQAVNSKIHSFTAQSQAFDRITRAKYALESLNERMRKDIAQENHWKDIEKRAAAKGDPAIAQRLKAEHEDWLSAKTIADEAMKRRGQINGRIDLTPEVKDQLLEQADRDVMNAEISMQKSVDRSNAIAAELTQPGAPAPSLPHPGQTGATPGAAAPTPSAPARGTDQSAQVSPAKAKALQENKGRPVEFGDGTTWIMDQNGTISRVH